MSAYRAIESRKLKAYFARKIAQLLYVTVSRQYCNSYNRNISTAYWWPVPGTVRYLQYSRYCTCGYYVGIYRKDEGKKGPGAALRMLVGRGCRRPWNRVGGGSASDYRQREWERDREKEVGILQPPMFSGLSYTTASVLGGWGYLPYPPTWVGCCSFFITYLPTYSHYGTVPVPNVGR